MTLLLVVKISFAVTVLGFVITELLDGYYKGRVSPDQNPSMITAVITLLAACVLIGSFITKAVIAVLNS